LYSFAYPAAKAVDYYKASYDAAALVIGKYSLYKQSWSPTDKTAQATNYAAIFIDPASSEKYFRPPVPLSRSIALVRRGDDPAPIVEWCRIAGNMPYTGFYRAV